MSLYGVACKTQPKQDAVKEVKPQSTFMSLERRKHAIISVSVKNRCH